MRERLQAAAARAGRPVPLLVAVTKTASPEQALELARLGQADLGENRVQELERKLAHFAEERARRCEVPPARWHLIGHLQRNKARRAAAVCHAIHSLDSLALGEALSRHVGEMHARGDLSTEAHAPLSEVFVEIDYSGAATRTGVPEDEAPGLVAALARLPGLRLAGLMTIAPLPEFDGDVARARRVFRALRALSERLPREHFVDGRARLSMGMTSDFEIAVEEESDVVRVGSALFAPEGAPR